MVGGDAGMKLVTYNIHYGIGLDGSYDVGRIADAVLIWLVRSTGLRWPRWVE
jgi:hypothetical protein